MRNSRQNKLGFHRPYLFRCSAPLPLIQFRHLQHQVEASWRCRDFCVSTVCLAWPGDDKPTADRYAGLLSGGVVRRRYNQAHPGLERINGSSVLPVGASLSIEVRETGQGVRLTRIEDDWYELLVQDSSSGHGVDWFNEKTAEQSLTLTLAWLRGAQ